MDKVNSAAQRAFSSNSSEQLANKSPSEAAKEFDTYFLSHIVRTMHEKMGPDPLFGGGVGEEIFYGFLLNAYTDKMAERISLVSDLVQKQLVLLQEQRGQEKVPIKPLSVNSPNVSSYNAFTPSSHIATYKDLEQAGTLKLETARENKTQVKVMKLGRTIEQMVSDDGFEIDEVI